MITSNALDQLARTCK